MEKGRVIVDPNNSPPIYRDKDGNLVDLKGKPTPFQKDDFKQTSPAPVEGNSFKALPSAPLKSSASEIQEHRLTTSSGK